MPLPRPIRQRSPMRTTGSVTHCWPGTMPADSDTCGPIIVPGADVDVALVDERRRREADHAAVAERPEAAAAPGAGPDRAELLDLLPPPVHDLAGGPLRPPHAARCHGVSGTAGRRSTPATLPAHDGDVEPGTHRADHRHPLLRRRGRAAAVAAAARLAACRPARPRRAHRRHRAARTPTTPPTARSPGRCSPTVPAPLAVIPGNHDIGFYGEDAERPRRLATFREHVGRRPLPRSTSPAGGSSASTPTCSATADHDAWLRDAVATDRPVLVFVHQPLRRSRARRVGDARRRAVAAFEPAIAGADVRVVASGHRHRSRPHGRAVWAPSLTLTGDGDRGDDPRPGLVEHVARRRRHARPPRRAAVGGRQVDSTVQHDDHHDAVEDGVGEDRRPDAAQQVGGAAEHDADGAQHEHQADVARSRAPGRRGRRRTAAPCTPTASQALIRLSRPRSIRPRNTISSTIGAATTAVTSSEMTYVRSRSSSPMPSVLLVSGMSQHGDDDRHARSRRARPSARPAVPTRGRTSGTAGRGPSDGRRVPQRRAGVPGTTTPTARSRRARRSTRRRRSASRSRPGRRSGSGWRSARRPARRRRRRRRRSAATACGAGTAGGDSDRRRVVGPHAPVEVAQRAASRTGRGTSRRAAPSVVAGAPGGRARHAPPGRGSTTAAAYRSGARAGRIRRRCDDGRRARQARCGRRRCRPTSASGRATARRRRRRRRGDRRRRLHRAVDGATTSPRPIRRCASSCSTASTSASAPAAATAAGARRCWRRALTDARRPARPRRGDRHAAGDARDRRRGRQGARRGGRRRRLREGRHDLARPHAGAGAAARRRASTRPARSASAPTTCAGSSADEVAAATAMRRHARSAAVHAALRRRPPAAAGPRHRRRRAAPGRAHPRAARRRSSDRAAPGHDRTRRRARRRRRAGDRGVHVDAARAPPRRDPAVLADGRLGAADGASSGTRIGLGRAADVQRRPPHDHLRPAHGRRAHRLRRPRRAVPLRVADRAAASTATSGCATMLVDAVRELFPVLADVDVPVPLGRAARRAPRLAVRGALRPLEPGWRRPAATSATASRRRTSPGARSPT